MKEYIVIASVTIRAHSEEDAQDKANKLIDMVNEVTEKETVNSWDVDEVTEGE